MSYLQRLLDTAIAAPPLSLGVGPASAAQSPIVNADQRLAQFPDAIFDLGAGPEINEPVVGVSRESQGPTTRPAREAGTEAVADPSFQQTMPVTPPTPSFNETTTPSFIPTTPSGPQPNESTPSQPTVIPSQKIAPVFQDGPADALPPTPPLDQKRSSPQAMPTIEAPTIPPVASPWPIPANDFQPHETAPEAAPITSDVPQTALAPQPVALPIEPRVPAVAAAPSATEQSSPVAHEPLVPTPPRSADTAVQPPPPQKITERIVERITEKPAPAPTTPQTAEEVSVIGPLRGLQPGRWRYFGGGF